MMMNKILTAGLLIAGLSGLAQAQVGSRFATPTSDIVISTAVYGGVSVSTYAATRVDNISTNGASAVLSGRTHLRLCNLDTNVTVNCAYDAAVSTTSSSAYIGEPFLPTDCKNVEISDLIQYWCYAQPAASSRRMQVQQMK